MFFGLKRIFVLHETETNNLKITCKLPINNVNHVVPIKVDVNHYLSFNERTFAFDVNKYRTFCNFSIILKKRKFLLRMLMSDENVGSI